MLEVIEKGSCSKEHPHPLLFVHGAWHGAWCWDEHFLDFFADKGYRALALSLRGHGGSPTSKPLRSCSIADYLDDVKSVADLLPTPPVLIGHSMGGYVVQKYLESHNAPAGVLVASVPSRGVAGFLVRYAIQHPWRLARTLITGRASVMYDTSDAVRKRLFSAFTPDATVTRCADRIQDEGSRIVLDSLALSLPRPDRVTAPMLVLGAESDACFTLGEVRSTARAYRTNAQIFPKIGHDVMLEPGWVDVAEHIHAWLQVIDTANA